MALKDKWVDKVDGVDKNSAEDINAVANAVIDLENKTYEFLAETEVTQEAIDAAGEDGIKIVSLGSQDLDLSLYDEIALRIHIPDSSAINTASGLLRIDFSDKKEFVSRDKDKFLLTQGTGISTRCGIDVTQNEFLVKGVWSADTFLYGEVVKNGYRGEIGYAGASNCWNCIFYLFKKSEKKFVHVKDNNSVFKFPVGTTVKLYGR